MAKKVVKKTKLKIKPFLITVITLIALFFVAYYSIKLPIKNIVIKNTNYLNDDYIIELAEIKDYPSFILTSTTKMKKDILASPYIENVKIRKKLYNILEITITEKKPLYINNSASTIVFDDKTEIDIHTIDEIYRIPRLINYVPDNKRGSFIKGMNNIKIDTLGKISDIEYVPNEYDKDRFLLYMDDGNMVYLTLTKFKMINYYNDVLTQLEGKKGILYLDSGNHFKIMG